MKDFKGEIPSFLKNNFHFSHYKTIPIDKLFVGFHDSQLNYLKYINIKESPHYFSASQYLRKNNKSLLSYKKYIKLNPDDPRSELDFINLIISIKSNGYNFNEYPILVFKSYKRLFPLGRYEVADGFHRLSILAALGVNKLNVAVLKRNKSILNRINWFENK